MPEEALGKSTTRLILKRLGKRKSGKEEYVGKNNEEGEVEGI